jgi:putative inorganic carbon (HCO3(-)) transporter
MRDVIITLMVFATIPYILRYPWYGVLTWSWLSYMNPHRLAWGFAYDMPFAQIVAITLFIAMLMSPDKKRLPTNPLTIYWIVFLAWLAIAQTQALSPDGAWVQLVKIIKIQLVTLATMMLMNNFEKVNQLIWVIVFSIGFYSIKGGLFTVMTGGGYHVFGPDGSDIQENNSLAVAVLMIIPFMVYMNKYPPHPLVKKIMPVCIFLSLASVIGSQSRGAFLAIGAVAAFFWWKSGSKAFTAMIFVLFALFAFIFMPAEWHERMASISDYQEDSSSMERIRAWEYSINVASARLTGAGLNSWTLANYHAYGIYDAKQAFSAHSIYFSVLADSGWPGLIIFLGLLFTMWRQLARVIRVTDGFPEREQFNFLARMLQISILAFMAGGAFLSLAYFDLAWHIMAITIVMTSLTQDFSDEEHARKKARKVLPRAYAYRRNPRMPERP